MNHTQDYSDARPDSAISTSALTGTIS
jgi:hypothetical protein